MIDLEDRDSGNTEEGAKARKREAFAKVAQKPRFLRVNFAASRFRALVT
jgi:hypothetical protein